jgi:DNA modification methylase
MSKSNNTVAEQRKYNVKTVTDAKKIAKSWLKNIQLENVICFGLPEIDDRYHIWRVPLLSVVSKERIGEIVIDAKTTLILEEKTTEPGTLEQRLLGKNKKKKTKKLTSKKEYIISSLRNTIVWGDSEDILEDLPAESVNLVFTSPPYFNARPEYNDYINYEEYLLKIRKIIHKVHRVLSEGRFFVMNISPILIRRASRSESSKRIAVPFDIHKIFIEEGYDFIDDIIWVKPEGAGWATSRGRRFSADKNPLQYKPVPVTEYILVYRKHTDKLIDWNIRNHPNKELVKKSKIKEPYEKTNIWQIKPAHDKEHPAIFPFELVEKVISYYSFLDDVVLDPFAGIGTVGKVAIKLKRRFVLIEKQKKYVDIMIREISRWLGENRKNLLLINYPIDKLDNFLF